MTDITDQNQNHDTIRTLSLYCFIRTFSYYLHISPFSVESFISSFQTNCHNPLSDHVHYTILKILIEHFDGLKSIKEIEGKLFDMFTWTEYIYIILSNIENHFLKLQQDTLSYTVNSIITSNNISGIENKLYDTELEYLRNVLSLISHYQCKKITYFNYNYSDKITILDCIISILSSQYCIIDNLEYRESVANSKRNSISTTSNTMKTLDTVTSFPEWPLVEIYSKFKVSETETETTNSNRNSSTQPIIREALPLFTKGDDGCVEVCILCGLEGMVLTVIIVYSYYYLN